MKFTLVTLAIATASVLAGPVPQPETSPLEKRQLFTDPTCRLSRAVTPGTPLSGLFPVANAIGSVVGPVVAKSIGARNRERIDSLGGFLCINSQEEAPGERGICQEFLQAVRDVGTARTPAAQSKAYLCLLDLACMFVDPRTSTVEHMLTMNSANTGLPADGTCQYLLRGSDCVANRILQVNDLECEGDTEGQ